MNRSVTLPVTALGPSVARVFAAGIATFAAAVACATAAAAEPPPEPPSPTGPNVPIVGAPLGPEGLNVLAQSGTQAWGQPGAAPLLGLDKTTVLGQLPTPSAPGAAPETPPNLNVFNNAYGPQQCLVPSAPGECQQFDVAPGQEDADVSRREWLGRYIDMYRAGMLRGGLLGQLPQQQLGEPLPGTAPPPGTNIPPGLGQFLPEPAAPSGG